MRNYHKVLTQCDSGEWLAQVYEIPWCVASGATPGEAIHNLDEALTWSIQNWQNLRGDVPKPLTESEWGDIVGKKPEDLSKAVPGKTVMSGFLSLLGYHEDNFSRN